MNRFFEWLAPNEHPDEALPLTLLLRAMPVLSLVLLALNDHYLKGSGILPGWVTGKLSDFAGLVFFPLLLVTLYNLLGAFLFAFRRSIGLVIFPSPTLWQLLVSCALTGAFFAGVQLNKGVADFYAEASAFLMFWSPGPVVVTQDPSDNWACLSLIIAFVLGARAIAKLPPYRLRCIAFLLRDVASPELRAKAASAILWDVRLLSNKKSVVDELVDAIASDDNPEEMNAIIARLR